MPFKSKAQERAAFSGALWAKMKAAAPERASKTNQSKLPEKKNKTKSLFGKYKHPASK